LGVVNRTKNNKVTEGKPEINLIASCNDVNRLNEAKKLELLTDIGGKFWEEAPSFRKPVLMMRDTAERPKALEAVTVKLISWEDRIL